MHNKSADDYTQTDAILITDSYKHRQKSKIG
jgi:hypothetical protein